MFFFFLLFPIISWVLHTPPSPDGFFIMAVWRFEGGSEEILSFFFSCLQLLSIWLIITERKWIKMSYLNRKSATEQKQLVHESSRKRKSLLSFIYSYIFNGGRIIFLNLVPLSRGHLEHLGRTIWFQMRFPSHSVHLKPFMLRLLARPTPGGWADTCKSCRQNERTCK